MLHTVLFSLQNVVYFIMLPFLVPVYSHFTYCCVRGRAGRPARPRTQHGCHHDTKVKAEAATAIIELLMMGGKTPEKC
jgi:heme/copper-type cytochrome/quinol oxidase subunit 2